MKLHNGLTTACIAAFRVAAETGESAYVVHNADDFTDGVGYVVLAGPWDAFLETCDVVDEISPEGEFSAEVQAGRKL